MPHQNELTTTRQIDYLVEWLAEFSDFQRADFLKNHLLSLYGPFLKSTLFKETESAAEDAVTNGVESLELNPRPPSIFVCRMKLLNDWFQQWSTEDRIELLVRIQKSLPSFVIEFYRTFLSANSITSVQLLEEAVKSDARQLVEQLSLINGDLFNSTTVVDLTVNDTTDTVTDACVSNDGSTTSGGNICTPEQTSQKPDLLNDVNITLNHDSGGCQGPQLDKATINAPTEQPAAESETPSDAANQPPDLVS